MNSKIKINNTVGKVIKSAEEWDDEDVYWLNKSYEERLTAIEILRQQYIEMYHIKKEMDLSDAGIRK